MKDISTLARELMQSRLEDLTDRERRVLERFVQRRTICPRAKAPHHCRRHVARAGPHGDTPNRTHEIGVRLLAASCL